MKNLANCKPSEFLRQTNRIRKSVEKWLDATQIMEIRKRVPELKPVPLSAGEDERRTIEEENKKLQGHQVRENISAILDAVLEKYPDETLEVLALCCFVEPENVDDYPMSDYISAFNELVNNEAVIGFFSLLMQAGQRNTRPASRG